MPGKTQAAGERRKGHTVKEFDRELEALKAMLVTMGCKVLEQFNLAAKALGSPDPALIKAAREADDEVDELEVRIDECMLRLLALRNPMALDLRAIIAAGKIATDLERIGDYSGGLAKRTLRLQGPAHEPYKPLLTSMTQVAGEMLGQVVQALVGEDAELAVKAWHRDDDLDELHDELIQKLTTNLGGEAAAGVDSQALLYAARALERIGDHVTNISEHVYFHVRGEKYRGGEQA